MLSKVAILKEKGRFDIETRDIAIKENEVLIKVEVCGLCNWELNFLREFWENFP